MKSLHELTRWNLRKKGKGLSEVGYKTILRNKKGAKPIEVDGTKEVLADITADSQSIDDEHSVENSKG
ncbi:hypothetical protein ACPV5O_20340 [Vibrio maritimus]|uniref:hypothetical protein n=1 Tax=Vibrio maritimus TaxID=990268 RepID=UPI00406942C5